MEDKDLRESLEALTKSLFQATYDHRWRLIVDYGGHRLQLLTDGLPKNRYNCFAYALGIYARQDYQELADKTALREAALVDAAFVSSLLEAGLLAGRGSNDVNVGDIVLYSDKTKLQHAALVVTNDGLCRSKWGPGELYEHGLWEVPLSYGSGLRVVHTMSSPDKIMAELRKWVDKEK